MTYNNTIINLHRIVISALFITLASTWVFHDMIWPCDGGTVGNSTSGTATVTLYDSTAHRIQREVPQPVAVVYRNTPQLTVNVPDLPPVIMHTEPASAPLPTAMADPSDRAETSFYIDCLSDTATSVRACVRDSIRGSRIVWREWETANQRPTVSATVTEHRPDRAQLYAGLRGAAFRAPMGAWEPMGGAGLRYKHRANWMMGASYLHGAGGSQAITVDADILIRFTGFAKRQRARRAERMAKRMVE